MAYSFSLADVGYLRSPAGRAALADADQCELSARSLIADVAGLKRHHPDRVAAVIETVRLRRRARGKLADADRLLLTDVAVQQASASIVADARAREISRRHRGAVVHDITCSVGADLAALADATDLGGAIGSDIDPVRLVMAAHNVPSALVVRGDALRPTSRADVIVADPARRSESGRIYRVDDLSPPLTELLASYAGRPVVIKCAPGLDYERFREQSGMTAEIQVVSLDGAVREVCLWAGPRESHRNRATVIRTHGGSFEIDSDASSDSTIDVAGEWIIDPDGAVVRAGLVRHFAARHGLWQLDPRIAYVSGNRLPSGERGWPVIAQMPLSEKKIRRCLADYDCGILEIAVRGIDIDPDALRKRLKPRGSSSMALVITRIGRSAVVYLCGAGVRAPVGHSESC